MKAANRLPILGRFPGKRCFSALPLFKTFFFLTNQRLNIWLFSYHFALLSVFQKWLLCQPTLFTKNLPNIGNIFDLYSNDNFYIAHIRTETMHILLEM